ncbi:MAG: transglycosylase SLT domain-containing protein [Bdellovibrio sp.]|nr:transglycosylase SLT domain-containing protein [Bdellovibrio sp.]
MLRLTAKMAGFVSYKTCVLISSVTFLILSAGCAPGGSINYATSGLNGNSQNSSGIVPTTPSAPDTSSGSGSSNAGNTTATPIPTQPNISMNSLAWETSVKSSNLWSAYIYSVISLEEPQMLDDDAALDADLFCPRYKQLNKTQRLNFWGQLFAGVAKFESGWKPTSYYVESTMGLDSITGRQVASEGLLQLSYQDTKNYGQSVCDFDWSKDRALSNSDSRKTIFDPYKNLRCGVKIMAKLLKKKQMISFESGVYWSVLRKGNTRVNQIATVTKSLSFCTSAN